MANDREDRQLFGGRLDDADRERLKRGLVTPEYVSQVKAAAAFAERWRAEHPAALLRWHDLTGTFLVCALDENGRGYLADSPDAHSLLLELDEATGGVLTVMQAFFALSAIGWV